MAHFKRGKFRKSFKGCCTLCSYRSTDGTRRRRPSKQERNAALSEKEQLLFELDDSRKREDTARTR
jgi:hypothetical protein